MYKVSMDLEIEYLLSYLEDDLRGIPDIRIHPVAPSGMQKSVDMPQDYDPQSNDAHLKRGVRVRADSREFFFPASWVRDARDQIQKQSAEIRAYCGQD